MSEQDLKQETPETVGNSETTQQPNSDDLLKRVSEFVESKPPAQQPSVDNSGDEKFDYGELNNITTPEEAKTWADKAHKSFQRGYNEKFQELSSMKKELERTLSETKKITSEQKWTPERIQALMGNPEFLEAAKIASGVSDEDELTNLSETEKNRFKALEQEIANMKQQNQENVLAQQQLLREKQHAECESKYPDYDRNQIDTLTKDMIAGKIQATNEHIFKAFKYDENVRKAYLMGRKDERDGVAEKVNSSSIESITTVPSDEKIVPEKGESSMSYWNKLVSKNLKLAKK